MRRKAFDTILTAGGFVLVVVLLVAGLLLLGPSFANSNVHSQLAEQQRSTPAPAVAPRCGGSFCSRETDRSALLGSPIPLPTWLTMYLEGPPIDTERCWSLLATGSYGRIALSVRALPIIVPVRYHAVEAVRLDVRPSQLVKVYDTRLGDVIAFQTDGFDDEAGRPWSVHAVGQVSGHDPSGTAFEISPLIVEGHWLAFDLDGF